MKTKFLGGLIIREERFGNDASPYMVAWKVLWRLRLHKFYRGDADRDPHDHPSWFITFPLHSYLEEVFDWRAGTLSYNIVRAYQFHFRPATYTHRIQYRVADGERSTRPIWSIVLFGRKARSWGFWLGVSEFGWLHNASEWIEWSAYYKMHGRDEDGVAVHETFPISQDPRTQNQVAAILLDREAALLDQKRGSVG